MTSIVFVYGQNDALILEDFDIVELYKYCPEQEVGVSVSSIYIQIAKFNNNPIYNTETQLLLNALLRYNGKKSNNSRYVMMQIKDIMQCFGKNLKKLPKSTFIQITSLKGQCGVE